MSVISRNHQVICITHLPQIASMADTHYIIEKNVENNKTISCIRKLSPEEEINEIARLLGGAEITEATITSAREMKGLAEGAKLY
jgi:DNA repair protein RecN (Recombination protein N)